ncbi:type II toxin-antitoxin system HicB family antitoxin [Dehalogenimonas etheniformans]|uniref:Type II toxin-antitoxin system HicB family antitoxin n=1 Tax=Dehalogenimonas etheniformans TaxID=1536648 RepID=A0A2P5P8N3_9CHLR|nr:type II toxin-antitoxin system HicB family antitoxin [Dehalogenimonas etheniformans]PPD58646.1 type II toxin-antitoxin system HicB family antitoxin [Dehalogenimonas etheniformans]QNT76583.1 type II toxin-antitoxin system HicB family antitoxin [Dehalogenimonas etheniformans]
MKYTVIIEKGREAGFIAKVPALKGCVSQGKTRIDAMKNVKEAAEAYIESLIEGGFTIPIEVGRDYLQIEVTAK